MIKKINCVALFVILCYNLLLITLGIYYINNNKIYNNNTKGIIYCKEDFYINNCIKDNSKRPELISAIASVESDYRPQVIGDYGSSKGLFQIQEKHWGLVPDSVPEQVKKADKIIDGLIAQYGFEKGIERYNGSGKKAIQYRKKVMVKYDSIRSENRVPLCL